MMPSDPGGVHTIRFGTRGSKLALAQTRSIVDLFGKRYPEYTPEIVVVQTEGDLDKATPLTEIGGRGVFTNAIERAILMGDVDVAVHSAKDLPTSLAHEAPIVAFPARDDPRDVLVSRHHAPLDKLPLSPIVGTSSRRRAAQILHLRPDARVVSIRGNIDTRLRKADGSEFDAVVLAAAGLNRMGWSERATEIFPADRLVPSPGQGALAVQARLGAEAAALLAALDDPRVSGPVRIERAFLAALGAGCTTPIGAFAREEGGRIRLVAMLASESDQRIAFADEFLDLGVEADHAAEIALRMKADIGSPIALKAWAGWQDGRQDLAGVRVVVTRPRDQAGQLLATLADRGAHPLSLPTIRIEPIDDSLALDRAIHDAAQGDFAWIAFTSVNAVSAVRTRCETLGIDLSRCAGLKAAVVGEATARVARNAGFRIALAASNPTGEALASDLASVVRSSERVLYPHSTLARDVLPQRLREAGVDIVALAAYHSVPEPDVDPAVLEQLKSEAIDALTFSSPSSVQNLMALIADCPGLPERVPAICAGPVTARAATDAGFRIAIASADPGPSAMADALAAYLCGRSIAPELQVSFNGQNR